jgi:hypothetical protein
MPECFMFLTKSLVRTRLGFADIKKARFMPGFNAMWNGGGLAVIA